ncbi:MAG: 2-phospho-L-lactate guanylyltransferase [Deltaproteobacteria bacterium]|nr:2-phospho-L-lactate guanylyltransferase [Deltaproteobacteria bacterium]
MKRPPVHVLIPVKTPQRAKGRLAELLSPAARGELARAMLRDVLRAAKAARGVPEVWVVSHDRSVLAEAAGWGARCLEEKTDMGLNPALRFATRMVREAGAPALLILPSDIPLVRPGDIERLLTSLNRRPADGRLVVGVPSKEGTGTNALLRVPPDVIPPSFGKQSFERHERQAARRNTPFRKRRIARIALDVDTPRDLLSLLSLERRGHTARVLGQLGLI